MLDRYCGMLAAAGFDVVGFDDAGHADAWLAEETPMLAVIAEASGQSYASIVRELSACAVPVVEPVAAYHVREAANPT